MSRVAGGYYTTLAVILAMIAVAIWKDGPQAWI